MKTLVVRGFTLIELLIVVAIIAILAAIAVPNFLEAQIRAKVSRVKSDLRSQATCIEAYYVDENNAPPQTAGTPNNPFERPLTINGQALGGTMWIAISTPIAYCSEALMRDAFVSSERIGSSISEDEQIFTYHNFLAQPFTGINNGETESHFATGYGAYRQASIGPDRTYFNEGPGRIFVNYDPTNGTVSPGNIWRSQKLGFEIDPRFEDATFGTAP
jgi:prepilin-type N-terminal cleavage/methylation domain-containing protein